MKKVFTIIAIAGLMTACNNEKRTDETKAKMEEKMDGMKEKMDEKMDDAKDKMDEKKWWG